MDTVAYYVEHVDRVLAAACDLLAPPEGGLAGVEQPPAPVDVPQGSTGLASGAAEAARRYRAEGERVLAAHDGAGAIAREALAALQAAAEAAEGIRSSAQVHAAALLPVANTPAGLRTLVDAMANAVSSMQQVLSNSRAQMSAAAGELRRHREDWQDVLEG